MIENILVASRFPSPLLDDLKAYCEENDLNQSQVIRKSVAALLYGNDQKPKLKTKPVAAADGWSRWRK